MCICLVEAFFSGGRPGFPRAAGSPDPKGRGRGACPVSAPRPDPTRPDPTRPDPKGGRAGGLAVGSGRGAGVGKKFVKQIFSRSGCSARRFGGAGGNPIDEATTTRELNRAQRASRAGGRSPRGPRPTAAGRPAAFAAGRFSLGFGGGAVLRPPPNFLRSTHGGAPRPDNVGAGRVAKKPWPARKARGPWSFSVALSRAGARRPGPNSIFAGAGALCAAWTLVVGVNKYNWCRIYYK